MTEPIIVPCLFVTGLAVEAEESFVRIVGWVDLPEAGYDSERRIISRVVLPESVARLLIRELRRVVGGN